MAARVWTPAEEAELRRRNGAGESLHSIAKTMGVSKPVLSRKAKLMGLTWDRSQTSAATAAHVVDAKARRFGIIHRMYDEVEAILTAVEAGRCGKGWDTILKGDHGLEERQTLPFIPWRDRRDAADTVGRYTDRAVRLEQVDSNNGAAAIVGLLQETAAALGIVDDADNVAP